MTKEQYEAIKKTVIAQCDAAAPYLTEEQYADFMQYLVKQHFSAPSKGKSRSATVREGWRELRMILKPSEQNNKNER